MACNRHAIMGRYTESEIWIFGEVIGRLSEENELAARSQLARRLDRSDKAPIHMVNKLAFDDSIEVAGPILRYSERLSNQSWRRTPAAKASNISSRSRGGNRSTSRSPMCS